MLNLSCNMCRNTPKGKAEYILPFSPLMQKTYKMKYWLICSECVGKVSAWYKPLVKRLVIKTLWCEICESKHSRRKYVCLPTMTKDWLDVLAGLK